MKIATYLSTLILVISLVPQVQAQYLVDDFDRPDQNGTGGGWWPWVNDGTALIINNSLHLSLLPSGGTREVFESSSFPGCDEMSSGAKMWLFKMRYVGGTPTGVGPGRNGAYVGVKGYASNGQGYAVVLGDTNSVGGTKLHFVRYSGGLSHSTYVPLLTMTVGSANFLTVTVIYDPIYQSWTMAVAESPNGFPAFGTVGSDVGPMIDSTYPILSAETVSLGSSSSSSQPTAYVIFDDIHVPSCAQGNPPVQIEFDSPAITAAEGGSTTQSFKVELSQASLGQKVVQLLVEGDGHATYGVDYTTTPPATNGRYITCIFAQGETEKIIEVNLLNNLVFEPVERFKVSVFIVPAGFWAGTTSSTVVSLIDDDDMPVLDARVFLDGAYDVPTGLMHDDLRSAGLIPLQEPYRDLGYFNVSSDYVTIDPSVLQSAGSDAIVDWVLIQARSSSNSAEIQYSRAALLQRDGDIVDLDGVSAVEMPMQFGAYYFSIRHRNHFGVMSATPVLLHPISTSLDLTIQGTAVYGTDARKQVNGTMLLWSGDVNADGQLKYIGQDNDRDPILVELGGSVPTNTVNGYFNTDVNLDGLVKYVGQNNDRDPILVNIGGSVLTTVLSEQVP